MFRFRFSGLRLPVLGFEVAGFGFQVPGFGFPVSGVKLLSLPLLEALHVSRLSHVRPCDPDHT